MIEKKETFFSEKTGKALSIIGIFFMLMSIFIFFIFGNWEFSKTLHEEKIGQYGDFIGGVIGSLFSLAGVILFYVALKEQRKDININQENLKLQTIALNNQVEEFKDQKIELEETRKIYIEQTSLIREQTNLYKLQNNELREQSNTSRLQQFDSSFFSYLKVLNDLKGSFNIYSDSIGLYEDYFQLLYFKMNDVVTDDLSLIDSLKKINEKYFEVFNIERNKLSVYFKTIYRIMHLIDSSSIDDGNKQQYFKLLRAQLSDNEQIILHYNYQSNMGSKVRSYVIRYNFFKHLKILDRFEFRNNLIDLNKFHFESFLNNISLKVNECLLKYTNIEESEDIDSSENDIIFNLNYEFRIIIDTKFQLTLIFNKDDFDKNDIINRELFKNLIERQLYSILFLNKYKSFIGNEISVSTTERDMSLEFKYEVNQIGIL